MAILIGRPYMQAQSHGSPGVALVTGAGRRIGRALALALSNLGYAVAVHYSSSENDAKATMRQIIEAGGRASAVKADLSSEVEVASLLSVVADVLGEPVCVVNSASTFVFDDAMTFGYQALDAQMHVNLAAPLVLARDLCARRRKLKAGAGDAVVINLLDQKLFNPNPDFLSYTLSKSALHAATTLLAMALAPEVRVVGVAPGITLPSPGQSEASFAAAHRMTPLHRSSTPEDIVDAVLFAVRNRALTGTTLLVDGGQHLVSSERDVMFHTP
jgi:NAD(P)-dependent dehydrogenase (short-subunit alcohol dehydrogenase family)